MPPCFRQWSCVVHQCNLGCNEESRTLAAPLKTLWFKCTSFGSPSCQSHLTVRILRTRQNCDAVALDSKRHRAHRFNLPTSVPTVDLQSGLIGGCVVQPQHITGNFTSLFFPTYWWIEFSQSNQTLSLGYLFIMLVIMDFEKNKLKRKKKVIAKIYSTNFCYGSMCHYWTVTDLGWMYCCYTTFNSAAAASVGITNGT